MPKQSGLAFTTLTVDDGAASPQVIKNDVTDFDFSTPRGTQDVTGVDKSAYERILLLADFQINLNGVFDPDANKSHDVFKTVPSTSVVRTVSLAIASKTLANECIATDYALTRAASGEFTWKVPLILCDGATPAWA